MEHAFPAHPKCPPSIFPGPGPVSSENRWLCMGHHGNWTAWAPAQDWEEGEQQCAKLQGVCCPIKSVHCVPHGRDSTLGLAPGHEAQLLVTKLQPEFHSTPFDPLRSTRGGVETQRGEAACQRSHSSHSAHHCTWH